MNSVTIDGVHIAWTTSTESEPRERGRMLLRTLIAKLTGIHHGSIELTAHCPDCGGAHGKPRVVAPPGYYASVAHCAGGTVVAVATHPVGIDVELLGPNPERDAAIVDVAGPAIDPLRHWTRVEAVLKADGRGLRVDPRQVLVTPGMATLSSQIYRLSQPDLEPEWVVSVAVASGPAEAPAVMQHTASRRTKAQGSDGDSSPRET